METTTTTTKNMQSQAGRTSRMKTAAGIVGICLAVLGLGAMISLFVDYRSSETTDDAQIEQYLSPVNIRVPGYIKRICFTEHQHVRKGDTLLVLEDDEYRIRLKQAEAALMEARSGRKVVAHTLNTVANTASVYDASIVEAQYRADQLEKDYHRYSALLKKKATTPIVVEQYQTQWEMARARVAALKQQHYITRFVQDVRPDNPQSSIPFAQASLLGQMQGKDGLEASRLASTMLKGKVSLQATLVAMKDITGSTIWICLGGMAFALLIPYHKHERT